MDSCGTLDLLGDEKQPLKTYNLQMLPCRVERDAKITVDSRTYFVTGATSDGERLGSFRGRPLVLAPVQLPVGHRALLVRSVNELRTHQKFGTIGELAEWNLRNCPQSNRLRTGVEFVELARILHDSS